MILLLGTPNPYLASLILGLLHACTQRISMINAGIFMVLGLGTLRNATIAAYS